MLFDYLEKEIKQFNYHRMVFKFPNSFGASVVKSEHSYGNEKGLYELAVLKFDGNRSSIIYTTPITNDVVGHCTQEDIIELLYRIKSLK